MAQKFLTQIHMNQNAITDLPSNTALATATAAGIDTSHWAVSKSYVDAVAAGLDPKQSVKQIAISNVDITGTATAAGLTLNAGDRILLTNQTTISQNRIYYINGSDAFVLADDSDANSLTLGAYTFVETNGQGFVYIGGSNETWTLFTESTSISGSDSITVSSGTLSVNLVDADSGLKIVTGGTTAQNGLAIDKVSIAQGGTGQTTAAAALQALGGVGKHAVLLDGTNVSSATDSDNNTTFTITHTLNNSVGTTDVVVSVRYIPTNELVFTDVIVHNATNVKIVVANNNFNETTAEKTKSNYKVTIIG